jgi:hypothetical protein
MDSVGRGVGERGATVGVIETVGLGVLVEGMLVDDSACGVGVADGSSVAVGVGSVVEDGRGVAPGETLQPATQSKRKRPIHQRTLDVFIGGFIDNTPL